MASQVVIENPILNSPFEEPARHFQFSEDGITEEIVSNRRTSAYSALRKILDIQTVNQRRAINRKTKNMAILKVCEKFPLQ